MRTIVVSVMTMGLLGGVLGASALDEAEALAKPAAQPGNAPPKPKSIPSIVRPMPLRITDDTLLECMHKTDCTIRGKVGDGHAMLISLMGTDGKQRVGVTKTWKPGEVTFRVPNNAPFGDYNLAIVDAKMKPLSNPVRMFLARTAAEVAASCNANRDADGDGHDREECGGADCDDNDRRRYRGGSEVCDTENVDEDCDPMTFGQRDQDQDGHYDARCCNPGGCGDDCDDARAWVNPTSPEVCNLVDDNCDGAIDDMGLKVKVWEDADKDFYGNPAAMEEHCPQDVPKGFVTNDFDCDDTKIGKKPGAGCP